MNDLHFVERARTAALTILDKTNLQHTLADHWHDDGRVLTVEQNADLWAMLSTGERVLVGVLEQLAGQRSTVTIHDVGHRLDEVSRRAVVSAYEAYLVGGAA